MGPCVNSMCKEWDNTRDNNCGSELYNAIMTNGINDCDGYSVMPNPVKPDLETGIDCVFHERDLCPMSEKKLKSGMYGERAKIKVGKFEVSMFCGPDDGIWVRDTETDEGCQFHGKILENIIHNIWNEHF